MLTAALLASWIAQAPPPAAVAPSAAEVASCLDKVKEIHGGAGPWAVVGYRIGERALHDLGLKRHDFGLRVVHRSPAEVQYTCVADGLQAATGVSAGKLNLRLEEAPADRMRTVVTDRAGHRTLTFTVRPELARSILDVPMDRLAAEGERIARLPDDALFTVEDSKSPAPAVKTP